MKLKIVSDGTAVGTKVINAETEEVVDNCVYIEIRVDANKRFAECNMRFLKVPIEIEGDIANGEDIDILFKTDNDGFRRKIS